MPVILRGGQGDGEPTSQPPSPASAGMRVRGPFEPPGRTDAPPPGDPTVGKPPSAPQGVNGQPGGSGAATSTAPRRASVWEPASSTMDQIKDLYLTAEAIGEDALNKHFELVSDRQRQLIRDYFDHVVPGWTDGQDRL